MAQNKYCQYCKIELTKRWQFKYCSNHCQKDDEHKKFISNWLKSNGEGLVTKNISRHIKKYLINTFGEECSICHWNVKHSVTGVVPLEVEHLDGNAENNSPNNVTLLCPNCHSLTTHHRNLNKGNGRLWRRKKFTELESD